MKGTRSTTRTEEVYKTLKECIVFLDYEPGEQLREQVLRDEFGIGRTPLREILIRLQCEGLVVECNRLFTINRSYNYQREVIFKITN